MEKIESLPSTVQNADVLKKMQDRFNRDREHKTIEFCKQIVADCFREVEKEHSLSNVFEKDYFISGVDLQKARLLLKEKGYTLDWSATREVSIHPTTCKLSW